MNPVNLCGCRQFAERLPIKAEAVGWGFNRIDWNVYSVGIRYFSRAQFLPYPIAEWSHMYLIFRLNDGRIVIHEALLSDGWTEKPLEKLLLWRQKSRRNVSRAHWLPINPFVANLIFSRSSKWVGDRKSYAFAQILAMAAANTFLGRLLKRQIKSDDRKVTCSEGAAMLTCDESPFFDPRPNFSFSWDGVTPQNCADKLDQIRSQTTLPFPSVF